VDIGAEGGVVPPNPDSGAYVVNTTVEQPTVLSPQEVKDDYGYMFDNAHAEIRDLPYADDRSVEIRMGDWEIKTAPDFPGSSMLNITIKNQALNYEKEIFGNINSKAVLLPFPETDYAKGPMLIIVSQSCSDIFFQNKVTGRVTNHLFGYANLFGSPEIGTDIYEGDPYLVVAPPSSVTRDGDMQPGTRFFQYALLATERSRHVEGPAAGVSYFARSE
jgi:hypothetical protein